MQWRGIFIYIYICLYIYMCDAGGASFVCLICDTPTCSVQKFCESNLRHSNHVTPMHSTPPLRHSLLFLLVNLLG